MNFGSSLRPVPAPERAALQDEAGVDPDRLVVSWDEYLRESYPEVPSLWGNALLVKGGGYLVIGGDTGVGKTIFVSNLILSLADGREEFLGFKLPGRPVRVLFLEAEGSRQLFRDRIRQIAESLGVASPELPLFFHRPDVSLSIADPDFRAMVEQSRAEVVFLDPIGRFHAGNENDAGDWRAKVTEPLAEIARDLGVAFIFSDHYTKPNEMRSGHNRLRGSAAKLQDCGAGMRLEVGKGGGASRVLYFDRVRDGALPFPDKEPCRMPLRIDLSAGTLATDESEDADGYGSAREGRIANVVEIIQEAGPVVRTAEILRRLHESLDLEKSRANDLIATAIASRAIERAGHGLYRLPGDLESNPE